MAAALWVATAGAASAQAFSRADTDHDGFASFEEARRVMPRLARVHFDKCDLDSDGWLSRGEFNCAVGIYNAIYRG